MNSRTKRGFTLIELLVVIAIIGILAAILLPAIARCKRAAMKTNEISAAKQLMLAYHMNTDDNEGRVLPGYKYGAEAKDNEGNDVHHPINARYPWRIIPYLGDNMNALYVNENKALLSEYRDKGQDSYVYGVSVFPSYGINSTFVGGDDAELPLNDKTRAMYGDFCVTSIDQSINASSLLVFASARSDFEGRRINGYYNIKSPNLTKRRWGQNYAESGAPQDWGFVHPRYNNRAVVGLLDGHCEAFGLQDLQDMRHWSNQAEAEQNPDWVLKPQNK